MVAALVAALLTSCGESRRPVRVDPVLANWSQPYRGFAGLTVHVFNTGKLEIPAAAVFRGGSWFARRALDVPAFVIDHPNAGLIVFDTGLSPRVQTSRWRYLGWLLTGLAIASTSEGRSLPDQMVAAGLDPERVTYVVLSHMHFDHTGSVDAFPNATIVTAQREKATALRASRTFDFFRSEDWSEASRWAEIRYEGGRPYATFASHHDLLGDGTVVLIDLHGHTPGSQGMIVNAARAPILLAGDAAWVEQSWRYASVPISASDMDAWWEQIWRIKKFAQLVPESLVIPGHDLKPLERAGHPAVVIH